MNDSENTVCFQVLPYRHLPMETLLGLATGDVHCLGGG